MFVYKDGEPFDTEITIDIRNYDEAKSNAANSPYVDIEYRLQHKGLIFDKDVSVDWYELDDLLSTFDKFMNNEIMEYYVWDHIEGDLEFHFDPKNDEVLMKTYFSPSGTHVSGIFVEMYSKNEYVKFYDYLSSIINR